jgi:hypothetical protein
MKLNLSVAISGGSEGPSTEHCSIDLPDAPDIAVLGLSLADAKAALAWLQSTVVTRQIAERNRGQRECQKCGAARTINDYHTVRYRSLFGDVTARIARCRACARCGLPRPVATRQRWISAEMEFVHSRLAATVPYARASELLRLLLPPGKGAATSTVRAHALAAGQRLSAEAPPPSGRNSEPERSATPVVVGLDSGYVRHCKPDPEGNFEVVAGRRLGSREPSRSVAFVRIVDADATRRLGAMAQGATEVFTDGDTQLRQWQMTALPQATHILDWYHLRRRVDQLDRVVHGALVGKQLRPRDHDRLSFLLGRLKWRLWHGRSKEAIRRIEVALRILQRRSVRSKFAARHIRKLAVELLDYLRHNADSLPDYGSRWRSGQRISSAFVESAVNQIIDKRMSKSQQMRWDPLRAHQLLQVRVRVVDGILRSDFERWHPGLPANEPSLAIAA